MSNFYKAWAKDDEILRDSSSGGVFSILAEYVIKKGGIVFGASQNSCYNLNHISISEIEQLQLIRKSKYYQSDFSNVFSEVSNALKKGQLVLVSGTACQIQSLKQYLEIKNISSDNLITVDVLCHGVANLNILKRYIESQENHYKKQISTIAFRTKEVPWEKGGGTSMTILFQDGNSIILPWKKDSYYLAFNNDLSLRPSCYECRFVGMERVSDFTLADFWGIKKDLASDDHLRKGVGLIVANTSKADFIMNSAFFNDRCFFERIDSSLATPYNAAFHTRRKIHPKRPYFFKHVYQSDFNSLVAKCLKKEKFIYWLKDIYHRFIKQ